MIIQKSSSNLGKAEKPPAAPVLQTDTDFFMTKLAIDEYDFRNEILDKEDADHESEKLSRHGEQEDEIDEEAEQR